MGKRFNRHLPRLCHACGAPMPRQEDSCWSCGARWVDNMTAVDAATAEAAIQARAPTSARWADEGGSGPSESGAPPPVPVTAQR